MADGFIAVQKGDEIIHVHPDALANHIDLGWVVVRDVVDEKMAVADDIASGKKPTPKRK